jgi:nicotinamidase/pyrazinamidase
MEISRRDVLLLIDLQRDFLPGGALAVAGGDEVVRPIARLCERFETVVATQDFHPRGHVSFASSHPGRSPLEVVTLPGGSEQVLWPDHCVAGSPGAALHPALPDHRITLILRKGTRREADSYSAFQEQPGPGGRRVSTGLGAWLRAREIERCFVVGLATDYCVSATAIDAAAEGFEVIVIAELTRAVHPERWRLTEEAWRRHQVRTAESAHLR